MRGADYSSPLAAPYISEFVSRKTLSKIGFKDDLNSLDCLTADAFCIIESELTKLQNEKKG